MLSLTLLLTSLLAGFTVAQNSTSTLDPNSVDLTTRNQWCLGQKNNCPILCGGMRNFKQNDCDGATLTYKCICSSGSEPANIADYLDTLPNSICNRQFADCRTANPGSQSCKQCGTKKASEVQQVAATTSAAAMTSEAAATTAAAAAATTAAGSAGQKVENMMGGMVAGLVAAVFL